MTEPRTTRDYVPCPHRVDVGDRYEVILPCLLWQDHPGFHEEEQGPAIERWRTEAVNWKATADAHLAARVAAADVLDDAFGHADAPYTPAALEALAILRASS